MVLDTACIQMQACRECFWVVRCTYEPIFREIEHSPLLSAWICGRYTQDETKLNHTLKNNEGKDKNVQKAKQTQNIKENTYVNKGRKVYITRNNRPLQHGFGGNILRRKHTQYPIVPNRRSWEHIAAHLRRRQHFGYETSHPWTAWKRSAK